MLAYIPAPWIRHGYYYPRSSYIAYIIVDDESFLETAMMANATMHHSGHINKLVYNSSEQTTTN